MTPSERYQKIISNVRLMADGGASNEEMLGYLGYEGLTGEEFASLLEGPTVFGQIKEGFKGLVPGAVGLVESAVTGASAILPESMEQSVRSAVQDAADTVRKPFQAAPGYEETVGRKLGEAVGSTVPFLAAGPFGVAGRAAAVGLGVGAGAGEARVRAEQGDATEGERAAATALGVIPGALEVFAPFRILGRLGDDVVGGGVDYVKRAFVAGGEEAAQEAASGFVQNLIAKGVYKPEQELIEGLGEQAAYGGATGAIIQGLLDLAIGRRSRPAPPTETPETTEPTEPTPVGVPADAEQLSLFPEEEMPVALTPDESVYAMREESMIDEARRQQALGDADELRGMFDILQRENERLAAAYDRATTDEERARLREEAKKLAPQLEQVKAELQKVERKLPKEDRGRVEAPPEQMGLDFDMPLMERQKTGQGVVLGETPDAAPESLSPEQQTFFADSKINAIRQRLDDGQSVTPAEMAQLRIADSQQQLDFEAAPTPELVTPEEKPEARPPLSLQRTDIEQPSAAPRGPITVTPEGEAITESPDALQSEYDQLTDQLEMVEAKAKSPETEQEKAAIEDRLTEIDSTLGLLNVEERRVSEDDFTQMGIGKTNKKLRELLIGKDIADPAQREEVRSTLEDFANAPNRSEKLRTGVENFLSQPMFMEQMGLDLQPRRKPRVRKPKKPVGQPSEPSVPPPSEEGTAPSGIGAFVAQRMGTPSGVSGISDEGEGGQQPTLRREFVDAARKTYNRIREEGAPSWRELTFDQQMEFLDAFEEARPNIPRYRYRLAEPGTKGMRAEQVTKLVDRLTSKWQNRPDIFVVQSVDELADYGLENVDPSAKGVFEPGTQSVFLIANNITGYNDAVLTIAHESIGHFGLQSVLGKQYKQTMNRLYQNPDVKKAADAKMKADPELTREIAVEEVIAEAVERKLAPQSGLARAVATLRNLLRDFFRKLGVKASNSEIDTLIAQSANYVISGTVQVDKAVTNTDAFKQWFGDSKVVDENGNPKVVYHGTSKFQGYEFRPTKASNPAGNIGGYYFSTLQREADEFAGEKEGSEVIPVFLSISDPYIPGKSPVTDSMRKQYYDEMLYHNRWMSDEKVVEYAKSKMYHLDERGTPLSNAIGNDRDGSASAAFQRIIKAGGYDGYNDGTHWVAFEPTQIKSAIGNIGTFKKGVADIRYRKATPTPTKEGQAILNTLEKMGRKYEPPQKGFFGRTKQDDSKVSKETARSAFTEFLDKIQTYTFSPDAALNNAIRRDLVKDAKSNQELTGTLLNISMSQTVHDDAVAHLALVEGKIEYDPTAYKYTSVKDKNNFVTLARQIQEIANKYGYTVEAMEKVGHTAFEARRLNGLREYNAKVAEEVKKLNSQNKKAAAERRAQDAKYIHMTDEQIDTGLTLFNQMPELNSLVDTWNGMRANHLKIMVDSGLYTPEEADFLLTKQDYVPFTREEQIEDRKGPKEFLSGLGVNAREKGFKGSDQTVNDVFDNMARWTQYAIKRAVRNRNAVALVDAAVENGFAKKAEGPTRDGNTVKVWRDGVEEFYDMADPMYMEAFKGLESVSIPTINFAARIANYLRQSVVLFPLFSVAQVPQDAFAAMFSSGLKTRYALTIPARVVKEYIKTLAGASKTHEELKKYGAVGVRDFSSAVARMDAEVYSGLKKETGLRGLWEGTKRKLEHIAMASDNAVRQAVYETALAQGLTKAEAIEKAFEIINFRRRGTSKMINLAAQTIPFFNAYLSAQNVAIKTISGVGISPGDRAEALKTLAATTSSVMALSLIYAMMVSDDEDYLNTPPIVRDRLLMIPGTGGVSIPLRPDIFSLPKILTEHAYLLMTDNGTQDGRKFRDSMSNALVNAISSPTAVPQVIKPFFEVGINYNFFQGRPLIGMYQQSLETGRQFNDTTSELAKAIGSTNLVSPIAVDHIVRGVLGTTGGLILYMTNGMLQNDPMAPRPELSFQDAIATFPGMSPFVRREYGTALKNDFYVLREDVDRAVDTLNDLERRSPQDIMEFLADEKNINRIGISTAVNYITNQLGEIRRTISTVTNAPNISADQKKEIIAELRDLEKRFLESVNLKGLRQIAQV